MKHRLNNLTFFISLLLIATPYILRLLVGEYLESISAYAYSDVNYVFDFLLTLAGAMLLFNGSATKKYYNTFLGLSLFGVVLFPYLDFPIPHYIFAALFYVGSGYSIIKYSSKNERWFKLIAVVLLVFIPAILVYLDILTLLQFEWLGLSLFAIHNQLENRNIID